MPRLPVAGPIVIPGAVQMNVYWTSGGKPQRNVYHGVWSGTGSPNPALAQSLFTAISTAFGSSSWASFVGDDCTLQAVGVKDLRTANQVEYLSTGGAVPGTGTLVAVPASTALVVTLRTANSGRAFRGRTYLGSLADNAILNQYDATAAANVAAIAFVQGIMAAMAAQSMPMGIGQRALQAGTDHKGNPLPARAAAVVPVTQAVVVNPRLDTQRRRLGR